MGKKTRNPNKLEKQAAEEARVAEALQARRAELEKIVAAHKAQQLAEARAAEDNSMDEDTAVGVGALLEEEAGVGIFSLNAVTGALVVFGPQLPPVDLVVNHHHEEDLEEDDEFDVITAGGNNVGGGNNEDLVADMAAQALADLNQAATGGRTWSQWWHGEGGK